MKIPQNQNSPSINIEYGNQETFEIISRRFKFTPLQSGREDLSFYTSLFCDNVNMRCFKGGARSELQIQNRCKGWDEKWKNHTFSALVIRLKETLEPVGHLVIGHGDFEGEAKLDQGWSEIALVIDAKFWNKNYPVDSIEKIGQRGFSKVGEEAVSVAIAYAKFLRNQGYKVPSDVIESQRPEVERLIQEGKLKESDCKRNSQGEVSWVYLPFKELKATCSRANVAGVKILEKLFLKENKGKRTLYDAKTQRYLYTIDLSKRSPFDFFSRALKKISR